MKSYVNSTLRDISLTVTRKVDIAFVSQRYATAVGSLSECFQTGIRRSSRLRRVDSAVEMLEHLLDSVEVAVVDVRGTVLGTNLANIVICDESMSSHWHHFLLRICVESEVELLQVV